MKYYVNKDTRLILLKMKWDFEDYEKDGIKYLALGEIDTCLINKDTREITQMGLGNGMFVGILKTFKSLNILEER